MTKLIKQNEASFELGITEFFNMVYEIYKPEELEDSNVEYYTRGEEHSMLMDALCQLSNMGFAGRSGAEYITWLNLFVCLFDDSRGWFLEKVCECIESHEGDVNKDLLVELMKILSEER